MLKERREQARRTINRMAQFQSGVGALPRDCMITDISERGARLCSDYEMPEKFVLSLSDDAATIRHECQVVWRLGCELGVEFTDVR